MRFGDLPRAGRAYIIGTSGLALCLLLNREAIVTSADWWLFATLAVAATIAHVFPVSSPEHRQAYHVSLPFLIAAAILLPAHSLALLILIVHLAEWARRRKRSWFAQMFNCCAYIVTALTAQMAYRWFWPPAGHAIVDLAAPLGLLAGAAVVLIFGGLNRALVSGILWLGNGVPLSRQRMLFEGEALFVDGLLLAMGLPLARLGLDAPWALVLGAAPALLIHRALDLPNVRAQGRRDSLTQLATAAAFKDACTLELKRARHFGRPLALVVLELSHFDQLVEDHGRHSADTLLRDAARLLQDTAHDYDVAARLERARFAILLPETDVTGARAMARHIQRTLGERGFDVASRLDRVTLGLRAGVASVQNEDVTADELLERACAALQRSASDGVDVANAPVPVQVDAAIAEPATRVDGPADRAATAGAGSRANGEPDAPGHTRLSRGSQLVVAACTVLAGALLVSVAPAVGSVDVVALGFLVALVAVGEFLSLQLFDRSTFSISVAPCLAAGMLLGVPGIVIAAPVSAIVRGVYRRIRWYKVVFNADIYVITGVAATVVYRLLAPELDGQSMPRLLIAATIAGLAYYSQTLLVATMMSIETRRRLPAVWLENFQWLWPQFVVLSVMGLFLALAYAQFGVIGAGMFALPPLMLRMVSKQYMDRTVANVRQLRELNDQLKHQAFHDPLTNLANRARLTDRVQQALERSERRGQAVVMLFIDLDNFKAVNDSLGHAVGDQLLIAVTERLRACLRASDTPARLGGDEFAVLLEDVEEIDEAIHVAERVLEALQAPFLLSEKEVFVNASIGIAQSQPGEPEADELLRHADVAMYAAKERGKGRYEIFESRLHTAVLRRLALEADLRTAIERQELVVYYQPTIRLSTGEIAGMEALVRWNHPERGLVPPGDFIGSAESSGLIVPIGRWVLREACRQAREWQKSRPGAEQLSVAVNLSARQLQEPGLTDDVADALQSAGLDPRSLTLEITETLLMLDVETAIERLRSLKALGVRLAIDDFGTGYSSLSYLRRFPVDVLKIDRSFVSGVGGGSQDAALTEAIVGLARTLRLQVVAEGIEQPEQLALLRRFGCDLGQGYYFARPLPVEEFTEFLKREQVIQPLIVLRAA